MEKIKINKNTFTIEKKKISYDELKFNPFNTRVHSKSNRLISNAFAKGVKESELVDELIKDEPQEELHYEFIRKYKGNSDYEALTKSIISTGGLSDERKVYVTNDNIVLSGNTRLSAMKKIISEGKHKISPTITVYEIKEDVKDRFIIDELETHFQFFAEQKVNYENIEMWMKMHSQYHQNNISYEDLANNFHTTEKEVSRGINTIDAYFKLLKKFKNKEYTALYEELDISSAIQYIGNDLEGKNCTKEIKKKYKEVIYNSILASLPYNRTRDTLNAYLSVKNKEFTNEKKIEALEEVNNKIIRETGGLIPETLELIAASKKIKENAKRTMLYKDSDPQKLIIEIQAEADRTKSQYDDTDEMFYGQVLKDFKTIQNRVNKKTDKYFESLEEVRKNLEKIFEDEIN